MVDFEPLLQDDVHGIIIKRAAVRLQINGTTRCQDTPISIQELRMSEPFLGSSILLLRIRERDPDLTDFPLGKESIDVLDIGPEEGYVGQLICQ